MPKMQNPSIVLYGPGKAKLEERPIPEIVDSHDVIVRIAFVGVCGSDVHFWNHGGINKFVNPNTGLVMGHEASGTIYSIGPAVTRVAVGDRVAIEPGVPCRHCHYCKSGSYNLCQNIKFAAAPGPPEDTHGTLCKYYKVAEDFVYKIGDDLSLEEAVMVEPLSVGVHSVKLGDVRPGETVVIMGSGTIGLMCGVVAKAFGAHRIILVDILPKKLEFAKEFLNCDTFQYSVEFSAEDNAKALLSMQKGRQLIVDTVIEASGVASSIETGINILRPGGKFVQSGMGKPKIEFPIGMMAEKELTIRGHFRYSAGDYELAISLLETGKANVRSLISSTTDFDKATEAWEKTARGEGIKNLIRGVA